MSFICARCSKPAPRNVSPEVLLGVHPHIFHDAKDNVVGQGTQIHVELKLCPDCSNKPTVAEVKPDYSVLRTFASGFAKKHARGCEGVKKRKTPDGETIVVPCQTCIDIMKTFAAMPPQGLNFAVEDTMAPPVKVSLGSLFLFGLEQQSERQTGRAAQDFAASYRMLKNYEQRGGGI